MGANLLVCVVSSGCVVDEECGPTPSLPAGTWLPRSAPTDAILSGTVEFTTTTVTTRYTDDTGAEWTVVYSLTPRSPHPPPAVVRFPPP